MCCVFRVVAFTNLHVDLCVDDSFGSGCVYGELRFYGVLFAVLLFAKMAV